MSTVPSGDVATTTISTRGGSVVAARIERLKSETKKLPKKREGYRGFDLWHLGPELPHGVPRTEFFPAPVRLIIFKRFQKFKRGAGQNSSAFAFGTGGPATHKYSRNYENIFLSLGAEKFSREIQGEGGG